MRKFIQIYATCELTPAFNHVSTSDIKNLVGDKLTAAGFEVTNLSVNYSASSLSFSNVFQLTLAAYVDNNASDEQTRQYTQSIIGQTQVATNYGLFQTSYYPLFSSVDAKLVTSRVTDSVTQINPSGISDSQSAIKNLGIDNLLTGVGFSSPIALAALAVFLVVYLKR